MHKIGNVYKTNLGYFLLANIKPGHIGLINLEKGRLHGKMIKCPLSEISSYIFSKLLYPLSYIKVNIKFFSYNLEGNYLFTYGRSILIDGKKDPYLLLKVNEKLSIINLNRGTRLCGLMSTGGVVISNEMLTAKCNANITVTKLKIMEVNHA